MTSLHSSLTSFFCLEPFDNASLTAVGLELKEYFVPHQYPDTMKTHLAGEIRENFLFRLVKFNAKHDVGKRLDHHSRFFQIRRLALRHRLFYGKLFYRYALTLFRKGAFPKRSDSGCRR